MENLCAPDVMVVFVQLINDCYLAVKVLRSSFFKLILHRTNAKDDYIRTSHSVVVVDLSFWDNMLCRLVNSYRRFEVLSSASIFRVKNRKLTLWRLNFLLNFSTLCI
jgi:hypothetical protein